ncbi:nuclear transport factor 2 family protein [Terrimonas pollutisoli]|uniref:nuclear transport factor 2 family protein n=1 Tax=Terrimonas pollutisoli TaxID=3034147 RepID=UPI0023ECD70D|nr:nuclear transport factor 2 family protein [Terrimonas sp. H1YJ31]
MRFFLTLILFFTSLILVAQADSVGLKEAMRTLDKALMEKDSVALSKLLHNKVSFGHSNGWVQMGKEVWNDLVSGKLVYKRIDNGYTTIAAIDKKWATVRMNIAAEGKLNDKVFAMNLHVLQVWMKTKKGWQLVARQSAKIN